LSGILLGIFKKIIKASFINKNKVDENTEITKDKAFINERAF